MYASLSPFIPRLPFFVLSRSCVFSFSTFLSVLYRSPSSAPPPSPLPSSPQGSGWQMFGSAACHHINVVLRVSGGRSLSTSQPREDIYFGHCWGETRLPDGRTGEGRGGKRVSQFSNLYIFENAFTKDLCSAHDTSAQTFNLFLLCIFKRKRKSFVCYVSNWTLIGSPLISSL